MKRIITLFLAAGLTLGASSAVRAADIAVKGLWDFNFEWSNSSFLENNSSEDFFKARQRLRTQVDIIASESLRGVLFFEIGDQNWGRASQGASLGTDGTVVEVRYSYIDWVVPETELKVRMGLQPLVLPSFVAGSQVLNHDGAGIVLSYTFDEMVGATLFWNRLENDNGASLVSRDRNNRADAFDLMGLTLPLTFEGVKITPWGAYARIGRNALSGAHFGDEIDVLASGMTPVGAGRSFGGSDKRNGNAWWAGVTGEFTFWNPFRLAFDANYGGVDMGTTRDPVTFLRRGEQPVAHSLDLKRRGWIASVLAEYKLDALTPGLIFWYGSGDDDDPFNGSERMPVIDGEFTPTSYGFAGAYGIGTDTMIGDSAVGTWGIVGQLKDITFVEDLQHTLRVGYYRGTNDKKMARYATPYAQLEAPGSNNGLTNAVYLTTKDSAWEVNFDTQYNLYDDLALFVELGYLRLDLDDNVWGNAVASNTDKNNFKAGVNLRYAF